MAVAARNAFGCNRKSTQQSLKQQEVGTDGAQCGAQSCHPGARPLLSFCSAQLAGFWQEERAIPLIKTKNISQSPPPPCRNVLTSLWLEPHHVGTPSCKRDWEGEYLASGNHMVMSGRLGTLPSQTKSGFQWQERGRTICHRGY